MRKRKKRRTAIRNLCKRRKRRRILKRHWRKKI